MLNHIIRSGVQLLRLFFPSIGNAIHPHPSNPEAFESLQSQLKILDKQGQLTDFDYAARIILKELQAKSPLQRVWRPIVMLSVMVIIINHYLIVPYLNAIFDCHIITGVPDSFADLLIAGLGGYVIGKYIKR
jgi:hypothetical protein